MGCRHAQGENAQGTHVSDVWGVAFTPDGKTLVSGDGDWNKPGEVKLWNVEDGKERATLKHTGEVLCVADFARRQTILPPAAGTRRCACGSCAKCFRG